ncbi:acyltransferase [Brucellaceae bacterium VT-16-1752]|nr:acyltransferase [Brucellaceae bacterium VT-16-1752]
MDVHLVNQANDTAYRKARILSRALKNFIVDRIARLYPLHFATLIVLVGVNVLFWCTSEGQFLENGWSYGDGRFYTFVLNLFLLQNVGLTASTSWNAPSWSISVEFWINILLALVLLRVERKIKYVVAAVSIGAYVLLFWQYQTLKVFTETEIINSGLLRGIGGIGLGYIGWIIYSTDRFKVTSCQIAALVSFAAVIGLSTSLQGIGYVDFIAIPFMAIFVVSVATWERQFRGDTNKLRKLMEILGASSYSVYLIHWPIFTFVKYQLIYQWKWDIVVTRPLDAFVILMIVCVLSFPTYLMFELPSKRYTKKILSQSVSRKKIYS